jgi:hypothetical protein
MAKRTRHPNRTTAKLTARRAARAANPDAIDRAIRPAAPAAAPESVPHEHLPDGTIRATRSGLTEAEVRRAAELEAEATALEKAAIAESLRRRTRGAAGDEPALTGDVNAPLSVRAAHEYAYVSRDVKRIALTGGLMIGILAVLHVLVNVMGVITF